MSLTFNIRDFGAIGNGRTNDTEDINRAVAACHRAGGGQVLVPPGVFITGTVRLLSNVTLYLDAGATLKGSDDPSLYETARPEAKGPMRANWYRAMILATDAHHVTICGPGTIDGSKVHDPHGEEKMRGPHTIIPADSSHIVIRDITIIDSANYAIFPVCSDEIDIHNVTVQGGWDAFHIRGTADRWCKNITVTNCRFFSGDDCIAGTWVENIVIDNCLLNSSCNAIRWIGPARDMLISRCVIFGPGRHPHRTQDRFNTLIGITLQPSAWSNMPGELDRVQINDITMHNVMCPLMCFVKPQSTIGRIEVNRLTATGVYQAACSFESWADEAIGEVVLRNVDLSFALKPENVGKDFEVTEPRHGSRPLPVWGVYARRVGKVTLQDVRLHLEGGDPRPVVRGDEVGEMVVENLRLPAWVDQAGAVVRG